MQGKSDRPSAGLGLPGSATQRSCWQRSPRVLAAAAALLCPLLACGQGVDDLKAGVVRVLGGGQTGTGIIVRIDGSRAYIATAAHVVKGSTSVEFFTERNRPFAARLLGAEPRGAGGALDDDRLPKSGMSSQRSSWRANCPPGSRN